MIDDACAIVGDTRDGKRLREIVEWGSVRTPGDQSASDPYGAERLQPVCVLDYFRLDRLRRDAGGKTVRLNGMLDCGNMFCRVSGLAQEPGCAVRCKPGSRRALR